MTITNRSGEGPVRIDYPALPAAVRAVVQARTGAVLESRSAEAGTNAAVLALLETEGGRVFLKAVPEQHRAALGQQREADVNPYVRGIGPRMLWHEQAAGWDLLAFEAIDASHADYRPGSPDLAKLAATFAVLGALPCPPVPMLSATRRWAPYLDRAEDQHHLAGSHLAHTDPHPANVLITTERAWLVDWAWSTRGAAFIDTACLIPRLIHAGHSPAEAEDWAAKIPAWQHADPAGVTAFAQAIARLWAELADQNPHQPWRGALTNAAKMWVGYRARSC